MAGGQTGMASSGQTLALPCLDTKLRDNNSGRHAAGTSASVSICTVKYRCCCSLEFLIDTTA
jgi:hypothetical protein